MVSLGLPSHGGVLLNRTSVWSKRDTLKLAAPMDATSSEIPFSTPAMMEVMRVTVATPMATPRMVRKARTLLLRRDSRAMVTPSTVARMLMDASLRAKGDDGV